MNIGTYEIAGLDIWRHSGLIISDDEYHEKNVRAIVLQHPRSKLWIHEKVTVEMEHVKIAEWTSHLRTVQRDIRTVRRKSDDRRKHERTPHPKSNALLGGESLKSSHEGFLRKCMRLTWSRTSLVVVEEHRVRNSSWWETKGRREDDSQADDAWWIA